MLQETIVLSIFYILIVAIAYSPSRCPQTVSPVGAVEYFSENDDEPIVPPSPDPVAIVENPTPESAIATIAPLEALTSKQLKAIARNQKIPRYGSLTKKQLLLALT